RGVAGRQVRLEGADRPGQPVKGVPDMPGRPVALQQGPVVHDENARRWYRQVCQFFLHRGGDLLRYGVNDLVSAPRAEAPGLVAECDLAFGRVGHRGEHAPQRRSLSVSHALLRLRDGLDILRLLGIELELLAISVKGDGRVGGCLAVACHGLPQTPARARRAYPRGASILTALAGALQQPPR